MKSYRVTEIMVPAYPVLRLTFEDGLTGDLDLSGDIDRGPVFEPLKDEAFFRSVTLAEDGRSFGWRLDQRGHEIDIGADSSRADIETSLVRQRAARYRARLPQTAE
jgi:hypothetical protein